LKSNEAISYAEIPSKLSSGVRIEDGNKKNWQRKSRDG
jgi:hypothetical protein